MWSRGVKLVRRPGLDGRGCVEPRRHMPAPRSPATVTFTFSSRGMKIYRIVAFKTWRLCVFFMEKEMGIACPPWSTQGPACRPNAVVSSATSLATAAAHR